jgi:hypothetical protein
MENLDSPGVAVPIAYFDDASASIPVPLLKTAGCQSPSATS